MKPSEVIETLVKSDLYEPRKLLDIQDYASAFDINDFKSRPFLCHVLKFEDLTEFGIDMESARKLVTLIGIQISPHNSIYEKCIERKGIGAEISSKDIYEEWNIIIQTLKEYGL